MLWVELSWVGTFVVGAEQRYVGDNCNQHTSAGTAMPLLSSTAPVLAVGRPVFGGSRSRFQAIATSRVEKQEGLAVASIARDDPSTLPGDHPSPRARMHRDHNAR